MSANVDRYVAYETLGIHDADELSLRCNLGTRSNGQISTYWLGLLYTSVNKYFHIKV